METKQGLFIVIEGTDGSGKTTQFELLKNRLIEAGYEVEAFDFPQYEQPSSHFVKQYLNGEYGTVDEVGPYTASLFYALDRFHAAGKIRRALKEGKVVISNRYTGSNMGHQGTKFANPEERRGYFIWLDNLEFEMLRIPRPDISFVLRVPADIAQSLVDSKTQRSYTDKKRDIHKSDLKHLERAVAVYDDLCQLFPKDFQRLDCVRNDKLLDPETVQSMLWEKISPLLPQPPQLEMPMPLSKAEDRAAAAIEQHLPEVVAGPEATAGLFALDIDDSQDYVTNPEGPVYAFTSKLSPEIIATVMNTLGRGGGNLSTSALQAFAIAAKKDAQLLGRTIDTVHNPSAKQLINQHLVITGVSSLAGRMIEQGRIASYIEPSVRNLHYAQKDITGKYKYYTPGNLDSPTREVYQKHMDTIFELYGAMLRELIDYMAAQSTTPHAHRDQAWQTSIEAESRGVLKSVLPVAATTTIGIYASAQSLQNMTRRLSGSDLAEVAAAGKALFQETSKAVPAFAGTDGDSAQDTIYQAQVRAATQSIAQKHLPETYSAPGKMAVLTDVWPRNELDIVADMLYEHSSLPLNAIRSELESWPYARKLDVFEAYIGQRQTRKNKPGRALEKVHYSWDITCEYSVFRELQRHRVVDDLEWQALTPRYGYDVPVIIEAAGLSDQFETCFDISLKLHSLLEQAGYRAEAQYAVLFGHRMRWKVTYNAREAIYIHELRTKPGSNNATSSLVGAMHAQLAEVHPLLAEACKFVGKI